MAKASTVEAPAETATDTLEVQDSRTERSFNISITDGAIRASDLKQIRTDDEDDPGLLSYDPAFLNTAACRSAITYIDGDKGILRYRGYPIEQLAEGDRKSTRLNSSHLVISYA